MFKCTLLFSVIRRLGLVRLKNFLTISETISDQNMLNKYFGVFVFGTFVSWGFCLWGFCLLGVLSLGFLSMGLLSVGLLYMGLPSAPPPIQADPRSTRYKNSICSLPMCKLRINPIDPFDIQFDRHLFPLTATAIGRNKSRDLFYSTTVLVSKNKSRLNCMSKGYIEM